MKEPAALDGESEGRAESLRRALVRNDRFGFYLVLADGEARAAIVSRLTAWGEGGDVPQLARFPHGAEGVAALRARLATRAEGGGGWLLPDGDALLEEGGRETLEALNVARDRLWDVVGGPLVLVLAPTRAKEFMEAAPDLYEVRRGTWQLRALAPQRMWELAQEGPAYDEAFLREWQERLDADEREGRGQASAWVDARIGLAEGWQRIGRATEAEAQLARAEELAEGAGYHAGRNRAALVRATVAMRSGDVEAAESILRAVAELASEGGDRRIAALALSWLARLAGARGSYEEAFGLITRARGAVEPSDVRTSSGVGAIHAQLLAAQGKTGEALGLLRSEVVPRLETTDAFDLLATAWGLIADLLRDEGELKEAEAIFNREVIPRFERLNDPHAVARAAGRLGDVLELQGRLDEALHLHRDVALPIFERHADAREIAVANGKIADVLTAQGRLADALRLRRERELPAFERLHDRRERSLTLGKIAETLAQLGDADAAYDLLLDDVIPERERLGDPILLADAWSSVATVLLRRQDAPTALGVLRHDVLPAYERARHPLHSLRARLLEGIALGSMGAVSDAQKQLEAVLQSAKRMGVKSIAGSATSALSQLHASTLPRRERRAARRR